jgi:large subunit ribosomal protein L19
MQKKIIEFNQAQRKDKKIDFQAGDIVKVYKKIKEGDKERIQVFEGMIIAIKGRQSSSPMITVRKVSDGIGVEIIIPLLSPSIEKIELVKKTTARRAKLYFARKTGSKKIL